MSKEGDADCILGPKRTQYYEFSKKTATVKNVYFKNALKLSITIKMH